MDRAKAVIKDEEVVVYWASCENKEELYTDPVSLYSSLKSKKEKRFKEQGFFSCPSFKDITSNTYIFSSTSDNMYKLDIPNGRLEFTETSVEASSVRPPSIENCFLFKLSLSWIFFSEESLVMEITPAYFSETSHTEFGAIVPGAFDIGRWFRPINAEFQLWDGVDAFSLPKEEPIFYAKFNTNKKVIVKRFYMNKEIESIKKQHVESKVSLNPFLTLDNRYKSFESSSVSKELISAISRSNKLKKE
jgi:hypothetical protein